MSIKSVTLVPQTSPKVIDIPAQKAGCISNTITWMRKCENGSTSSKVGIFFLKWIATIFLFASIIGIPLYLALRDEYVRQGFEQKFADAKSKIHTIENKNGTENADLNQRLAAQGELLNQVKADFAKLQEHLKKLMQEKRELEALPKKLSAEIEKLSSEKGKAEAKIDEKEKRIREISTLNLEVRKLLETYQNDLEAARKLQEETLVKLNDALKKQEDLRASTSQDQATLKEQNKQLQETNKVISELREQLKQKQAEIENLKKGFEEAAKKKIAEATAGLNKQIEELQTQLQKQSQTIQAQEKQKKELEGRKDNGKVKYPTDPLRNVKSATIDFNSKSNSLPTPVNEKGKDYRALYIKAKDAIRQYKLHCAKLQAVIERLKKEKEALEEKVRQLGATQWSKPGAEFSKQKQAFEIAKGELERKAQQEIDKLNALLNEQRTAFEGEKEDLLHRIEQLEQEKRGFQAEIKDLREWLGKMEFQKSQIESELYAAKGKLEQQTKAPVQDKDGEEEIDEDDKEVPKGDVEGLKQRIIQLEGDNEVAENEIESLRKRIRELEKENNEFLATNERLKAELAQKDDVIQKLKDYIDKKKAALEAKMLEVEAVYRELNLQIEANKRLEEDEDEGDTY